MSETKSKLLLEVERRTAIVREAALLVEIIENLDPRDIFETKEVQKFIEPLKGAMKGNP